MRVLVITAAAAVLLGALSVASAQQAAAPTPGAENPKQGRSAAAQDKRRTCRQEGQSKGTRGPDLQDYVAICVAEARLACLKQAVEQKVRGPARRDFIANCLSAG